MGYYKEIVFLVLAAIATSNAFHTLVPTDKELVYTYKTIVKAATQLPTLHESVFLLEGKLHIQAPTKNASLVRLSDLTFKLYNGRTNHELELESKSIPLPEEYKDLTKPFKIVYDTKGQVLGISVDKDELMTSINMKKALASVLQLNMEKISLTEKVPYGFVTDEQAIYGKGPTSYTVVPDGDLIKIRKMHEMTDKQTMFHDLATNLQPLHCEAKWKLPITHDSNRRYILEKKDGHFVVKKVIATGGIYFYPFETKSEAHFVFVNQTMRLEELKPIDSRIEVTSERFEDDLTAELWKDMENGIIPDITEGRHIFDMDKIVRDVQRLLIEVIDYIKDNHIDITTPDLNRHRTITKLLMKMLKLDKERLMQFHDTFSRKKSVRDAEMLDVFEQMVPLVGTKAAVEFIKDLIKEKKVEEQVAVRMLQVLPLSIKHSKVELLVELEDLIKEDSTVSWPIKKASILAFSIMISRFQKHEIFKKRHMMDRNMERRKEEIIDEIERKYEKYVLDLVERVKKTEDFSRRKVYLEALQNIRLKSVVRHLEPAIRGKWFECRHSRLLAMWAASYSAVEVPEKLIELYWPILVDRREHPELRATAYYLIMDSAPSMTTLANVYWVMHSEKDPELYHFYYTHMKALMKTSDPCKQRMRSHIEKFMRYLQTPDETTLSGFYQMDYRDMRFGFGGGMNGFIFSTNDTKMISWTSNSNLMNIPLENYAVVLKISGLEAGLTDKLRVITKSNSKMFNYGDLFDMIKKIPDNKDIRIEGLILRQTYVIHSFFYDHTSIKDVGALIDIFNKERFMYAKNTVDITYDIDNVMIMPNDLGMPVFFDILFPRMTYQELNITREGLDKVINMNIDAEYKMWLHGRYGLTLYNPVVDAWQGVNRHNSFDLNIPIDVELSINTLQQKMKLTWKHVRGDKRNIFGMRSHAVTTVSLEDLSTKDFLKQSSTKSKPVEFVTLGDDYRRDFTLIEKDDSNTGLNYKVKLFDVDPVKHHSNGSFMKTLHRVNVDRWKGYETPFERVMMSIRNFYNLILLSPVVGMRGFVAKVEPSIKIPVTHFDLSLRLKQDIKRDDSNLLTPEATINGRATYVLKNEDKTVRTWDVNGIYVLNSGHNINNLKVEFTRLIPGQKDFKMCMDMMKKWTPEGVTGDMKVAMSHSTDARCSDDEKIADIKMTGKAIEEQNREHHTHGKCIYPRTYHEQPDDYTIDCLASFTDIRRYEYLIKTTSNFPSEFKRTIKRWLDYIKGNYFSYSVDVPEYKDDITEDNHKLIVEYPLTDDVVNVEVMCPDRGFKLESVPIKELRYFDITPDNMYYSWLYRFLHRVGLTDVCLVNRDVLFFGKDRLHQGFSHKLTDDWVLYMGDGASPDNKMFAVFVKKIDDKRMAVKITHESKTLELIPEQDGFKALVDGKETKDTWKYLADWVSFFKYPFKKTDAFHPGIVMLPHVGVQVKYDGTQVKVEVPKTDLQLKGTCVGN